LNRWNDWNGWNNWNGLIPMMNRSEAIEPFDRTQGRLFGTAFVEAKRCVLCYLTLANQAVGRGSDSPPFHTHLRSAKQEELLLLTQDEDFMDAAPDCKASIGGVRSTWFSCLTLTPKPTPDPAFLYGEI
jgi:hypothetical protein